MDFGDYDLQIVSYINYNERGTAIDTGTYVSFAKYIHVSMYICVYICMYICSKYPKGNQ